MYIPMTGDEICDHNLRGCALYKILCNCVSVSVVLVFHIIKIAHWTESIHDFYNRLNIKGSPNGNVYFTRRNVKSEWLIY